MTLLSEGTATALFRHYLLPELQKAHPDVRDGSATVEGLVVTVNVKTSGGVTLSCDGVATDDAPESMAEAMARCKDKIEKRLG